MKPIDSEPLYRDGRFYDLENSSLTADIPFYLELAKSVRGPVLEVACGTGRITLPLARAGIQMTGLDVSPGMLAQARTKTAAENLTVDWVEADCRNFDLKKKFKLIYIPFNSMHHMLDTESIEAFLNCVKNHLDQDGKFAFDVFNPALKILSRPADQRFPVFKHPHPDNPEEEVIVEETNVYDSKTQINHIKWHFSIGDRKDVQVNELNMRVFFPQELDIILKYNGFEILEKFGSFDKNEFTSKDMKQICICQVKTI